MNVFLLSMPNSEEDVEELLQSSPRFLLMPTGKRRMTWMPQVVWDAEAFAVEAGFRDWQLVRWALEQSEHTGFPFEITYPYIVYFAAHEALTNGPPSSP